MCVEICLQMKREMKEITQYFRTENSENLELNCILISVGTFVIHITIL